MDLLSLFRSSDLTGADGPNRFVSDNDLAPVLDLVSYGVELTDNDVDGFVRLTLFESFTDAKDDAEVFGESSSGFLGYVGVGFMEKSATFGVAEDDPGDGGLFEHRDRDFTGEGTAGLVVGVLRSDGDGGSPELLLDGKEVEDGGCNDDLYIASQQ